MSKITFSESAHTNDARIGKLMEPLKMYIQSESDKLTKNNGYETTLYKQDDSDSWAEAFVMADDFAMWEARSEGGNSSPDSFGETAKKVIEHCEYGKGFSITRKMLDDMSARALNAKSNELATKFVGSYHRTKNQVLVQALVKGASAPGDLENGEYIRVVKNRISVTTADGKPLFSKDHTGGHEKLHGTFTQSNLYYLSAANSAAYLNADTGSGKLELLLGDLTVKGRNMKNENAEPMGYMFDTIIIPGDNALLENLMRRALGSPNQPGTQLNDISVQFGTKNLLILPDWQTTGTANPNQFMLMSSAAKDYLHGNQLLERVPMDLRNWIDDRTRNWEWDGYARFGVGFPTYKHIMRMVFDTDGKMAALATELK